MAEKVQRKSEIHEEKRSVGQIHQKEVGKDEDWETAKLKEKGFGAAGIYETIKGRERYSKSPRGFPDGKEQRLL